MDFFFLKSKVSWTMMTCKTHSCQQEPEWPLSPPCISTFGTHYTAGTNATYKKGAKKASSPLTCDPGAQRGLLCMHTDEIQTEFMTALLPLFLIPSPPITGHQKPAGSTRHTRHRSFTHLLGAFVRWLLVEKGKQINTSPMGLTGNLYLEWNMSGTSLLDSLTVTGQLTNSTDAIRSFPSHCKFI